jgi:hypothetical protein
VLIAARPVAPGGVFDEWSFAVGVAATVGAVVVALMFGYRSSQREAARDRGERSRAARR